MLLPSTRKDERRETLEGTHEMKTKKNDCEWEKGHFSHYFSQLPPTSIQANANI